MNITNTAWVLQNPALAVGAAVCTAGLSLLHHPQHRKMLGYTNPSPLGSIPGQPGLEMLLAVPLGRCGSEQGRGKRVWVQILTWECGSSAFVGVAVPKVPQIPNCSATPASSPAHRCIWPCQGCACPSLPCGAGLCVWSLFSCSLCFHCSLTAWLRQ